MKRKGFTLIELLAVIVILAVIALIATPIIMNVINDSKKGAAMDAMYGYVKAVELASTNMVTATTNAPSGNYITKDGNIYQGSNKVLDVQVKGNKTSDNGTVILKNGHVIFADLVFDNIEILYNGSSAEVMGVPVSKSYTKGTIIYYNPETNKKCSSSEVNNTELAKTGCLKWNVVTTDDATNKVSIDMMLDHNTTPHVAWNSGGYNASGMKEALIALTNDAKTWNQNVKNTARLISGQEVANIGEDTAWDAGKWTGTVYSNQAWLYQNLSNDNTNALPYAYWTSTANLSNPKNAWNVYYVGNMSDTIVTNANYYGIRPVITISKSVIK